jgi:hypothetical protein
MAGSIPAGNLFASNELPFQTSFIIFLSGIEYCWSHILFDLFQNDQDALYKFVLIEFYSYLAERLAPSLLEHTPASLDRVQGRRI